MHLRLGHEIVGLTAPCDSSAFLSAATRPYPRIVRSTRTRGFLSDRKTLVLLFLLLGGFMALPTCWSNSAIFNVQQEGDIAGMCLSNMPALFRAPALLGIGFLYCCNNSIRARRIHRLYRGKWHYSTGTIGRRCRLTV